MDLDAKSREFWNQFVENQNEDLDGVNVEASMPGNPEIADHLINLYLAGKKTAGSGLLKDYQITGDELPKKGNFWIALDSSKTPRCILKTVRVEICRWDQMGEHVAIAEGEGDLSLEYWRRGHEKFFAPFLSKWGIKNLEEEDVVTEFFELVHR